MEIRIKQTTAKAIITFSAQDRANVVLTGNWAKLLLSAAMKALENAYNTNNKKMIIIGDKNGKRVQPTRPAA